MRTWRSPKIWRGRGWGRGHSMHAVDNSRCRYANSSPNLPATRFRQPLPYARPRADQNRTLWGSGIIAETYTAKPYRYPDLKEHDAAVG
ncbi:hypothetical protein M404DRAFT_1000376 [Pisolithus tinctorius Marx 270]|uniref:Uncharacterized protein n=1 Tax=Pisolithus tinctorius Marx 270 TaxID=870435 RepID=A0A0C3J768_PISTI|nr:hypothetical protein M404DRAFT_1000376 [Pisolithus tinctorius Marx 270]